MILSIILARALGPHGFGIYAYAFAIMNLLMILAEAGVPTLLLREIAAGRSRGAWGVVRGLMQRSLQVVALVSIGISLLGFLFLIISVQTITTETYHTFEAMLFLLPMVALSKTVAHALRGFDKVLSSQVLELILWPGLALLVAASFFVVDEAYRTPWAAMWAQAIAVGTTLFFAIALLLRSVPKEVVACAPEYEMRRWSRAFPHFMMLAAALVINNQVDIIMLSWVVDSKASGISGRKSKRCIASIWIASYDRSGRT
jgi:O-antigen/teichoic acid export membrane protein